MAVVWIIDVFGKLLIGFVSKQFSVGTLRVRKGDSRLRAR